MLRFQLVAERLPVSSNLLKKYSFLRAISCIDGNNLVLRLPISNNLSNKYIHEEKTLSVKRTLIRTIRERDFASEKCCR